MANGQTSPYYLNTNPRRKGTEIYWLLYTTKWSNCKDLAKAIAAAIGLPMAVHFKQIIPGQKPGMKASAVHLMVVTQHLKEGMQWLKQIYGENRMTQSATKFPLGQQLLLAPLATDLNKKLECLDQLLQKQVTFCKEITLVMNNKSALWIMNFYYRLMENWPNGHCAKSWCNSPTQNRKNAHSSTWSIKTKMEMESQWQCYQILCNTEALQWDTSYHLLNGS